MPFGDVGTRVSAILSLADEEAAQVKAESERYATMCARARTRRRPA